MQCCVDYVKRGHIPTFIVIESRDIFYAQFRLKQSKIQVLQLVNNFCTKWTRNRILIPKIKTIWSLKNRPLKFTLYSDSVYTGNKLHKPTRASNLFSIVHSLPTWKHSNKSSVILTVGQLLYLFLWAGLLIFFVQRQANITARLVETLLVALAYLNLNTRS